MSGLAVAVFQKVSRLTVQGIAQPAERIGLHANKAVLLPELVDRGRREARRLCERVPADFALVHDFLESKVDRHSGKYNAMVRAGQCGRLVLYYQRSTIQRDAGVRKSRSCCLTEAERDQLIVAWDGLCAYCREPIAGRICMEHVEPLSRGGEDVPDNIVPSCVSCNCAKHDLFLLEWAFYREGMIRQNHETRLPYVVDDAPADERTKDHARLCAKSPLRLVVATESGNHLLECGHRCVVRFDPYANNAIVPSRRRRCYECSGVWPRPASPTQANTPKET